MAVVKINHAIQDQRVTLTVRQIQQAGVTNPRAIAAALNARGIHTARGGQWHDSTVRNLLARA